MAAVITIFVLFAYLFVGSCVGAYKWERWEIKDRPLAEEDRFMGTLIMGAIWPLAITVMLARYTVKTVFPR